MPLKMGFYHAIGNDDWEPQRTNNFEIQFLNLGSLFTIDQGLALPGNASDLITLSVKSVSDPSVTINKLQVSYGNNTVNYAGKPEYGDVEVVVNDFIGIQTERILMGWHKLVYDPKKETIGWSSQYKRDAYLFEYSPDGTVVRRKQLRGVFPGNISPGGFSNEDNSIREISATFYCDVVIPLD